MQADTPLLTSFDLDIDLTAMDLNSQSENEVCDILEKERIALFLAQNHGNIKKTALQLGISRVTLYNKMRKYGLK